ncbi:MAG: hypothetical protein NTX97_08790 [Bacteroidetes bacterium]|nr:hypothetical protein [Bacteroidota bacterium]
MKTGECENRKTVIKIRFNHDCSDGKSYWRAIINEEEHQVQDIFINIPSKTTKDYLEDKDTFKWHITCESSDYTFKDGVLFIN